MGQDSVKYSVMPKRAPLLTSNLSPPIGESPSNKDFRRPSGYGSYSIWWPLSLQPLDSWPQLYTCVTNFPTAILCSTSPTYGQFVDVLQHRAQEVPEGGLASNQQLGPPPPLNYLRSLSWFSLWLHQEFPLNRLLSATGFRGPLENLRCLLANSS